LPVKESPQNRDQIAFSLLFWHVLIRNPAKADYRYKVRKQFGLALRSGTFLLDAGFRRQAEGQTKVQLLLNVPERLAIRNVGHFEALVFMFPTLFIFLH